MVRMGAGCGAVAGMKGGESLSEVHTERGADPPAPKVLTCGGDVGSSASRTVAPPPRLCSMHWHSEKKGGADRGCRSIPATANTSTLILSTLPCFAGPVYGKKEGKNKPPKA